MSMRLRHALPTVLLAGAVLVSGCADSDSDPKADGKPTNSAPGARPSPSAVLPDGIMKPGTALPAGSVPGVPAGSSAYTGRVTA